MKAWLDIELSGTSVSVAPLSEQGAVRTESARAAGRARHPFLICTR